MKVNEENADIDVRPPDPQVERTRSAVLNAGRELLFSAGPEALTHQRIAKAARVGRATVYRHWPGRQDLLLDVLTTLAVPLPTGDKGRPAIEEFRVEMQAFRAALWGELGAVFAALIGQSEWDGRMRPAKQKIVQWAKTRPIEIIKRGIEEDEFAPGLQPELIVSALIGTMLARRFVFDSMMTDEELNGLIYALLPGDAPI